jgi:hypothetical protein
LLKKMIPSTGYCRSSTPHFFSVGEAPAVTRLLALETRGPRDPVKGGN